MKHMEKKTTIWILDAAYVFNFSRGHGQIDYMKMKKEIELLNGGPIYETYFLNSAPEKTSPAQTKFINWLKSAPPMGPKMRVQIYPMKEITCRCRNCGEESSRKVQKGVDVGIATLALTLGSKGIYDRLILTAGDGDFEDAIAHVKSELRKEVWLNGSQTSLSTDLQSYADRVIWLETMLNKIRKDDFRAKTA
jgi:uncharacterized LabA/DUF88 family protein